MIDYFHISEKKSRGRRIDSGEIENCDECSRFCFPSAVRSPLLYPFFLGNYSTILRHFFLFFKIMDGSDNALCLYHGLERLRQGGSSDLTIASHVSLVSMSLSLSNVKAQFRSWRKGNNTVIPVNRIH